MPPIYYQVGFIIQLIWVRRDLVASGVYFSYFFSQQKIEKIQEKLKRMLLHEAQ